MNYATKAKQIIISLIGNCILGLGLSLGASGQLGLDPCVSFSQAISNQYGVLMGTVITCVNVVLIIITLILAPKNVGLTTVFVVFLNKYPVDFFNSIIHHSNYFLVNVFLVTIGTLFIALGCNTMIKANIGMGIYDAFIFSISSKTNKEYVYIRYIVDACFLVLTFLFKGFIGLGTIISYFLTGNLIKITRPYVSKVIDRVFWK